MGTGISGAEGIVDTVGKNTAAIKAYIQNQIKEDPEYDQMSIVVGRQSKPASTL